VPLATGVSPYVRYGDWVPALALALLAGAGLRAAITRRNARATRDDTGSAPTSDELAQSPPIKELEVE
jgi:apolipoprotein N-acyltransferase